MLTIAKKVWLLGLACLAASGCGGRDSVVEDQGPELLYERGSNAMESSNYPGAIQYFSALEARYPFSPETRQAQLDLIYLFYRSQQPEEAIDAAEEFERENPTHPRIDYTLYMRGIVYFDQAPNIVERVLRVDLTLRPPKDTLRSFAIFQDLLRRFPDSEYATDARQRMVFLRNRLAQYENHVADYYMRRGAYVAAINRAKYALEHYPEAPELETTLQMLAAAYERLGMNELAADARRVLRDTFGEEAATAQLFD